MLKNTMMKDTRGIATLEFAFILPILCMMIFAVVDIGWLVESRLVVTNVSREGANLASHDLKSGADLLTYLASSSSPIDLVGSGKIYVTTITAGTTAQAPDPVIASQISTGNLSAASGITTGAQDLGLNGAIYNHLVYNPTNKVADILGVTVVEVYYHYTPMTPLASFIPGLPGTGTIIASKAVFCISGGM
jgi:Flp pilus assembly protein TadG